MEDHTQVVPWHWKAPRDGAIKWAVWLVWFRWCSLRAEFWSEISLPLWNRHFFSCTAGIVTVLSACHYDGFLIQYFAIKPEPCTCDVSEVAGARKIGSLHLLSAGVWCFNWDLKGDLRITLACFLFEVFLRSRLHRFSSWNVYIYPKSISGVFVLHVLRSSPFLCSRAKGSRSLWIASAWQIPFICK